MKKLFLILFVFLTLNQCIPQENLILNNIGNCRISLDKEVYKVDERITLTVSWNKYDFSETGNDISFYLINGDGTIQILSGSKIIREIDMTPVSAPKIEGEMLSFKCSICDFKSTGGEYLIRVVSHNWTSNEVKFVIQK